jgi:Protein of unknown function DUF262
MKNFDSRTYSINDFLEWSKNDQLELSPRFQRRSVWTDSARSFLMDTIIRGKPIPKVFIRQKLNTTTKKSIREIVDGQQRMRTILSYLNDGFQISKRHHPTYGGYYFSQLNMIPGLDEDVQAYILNYEISVDLLVNMPDEEVLDVFGRLNSYAVVLNEQEKLNANHFGPFKTLADGIGRKYYRFWIDSKVLSENDVLRMGDANLVADLLIAMMEGIKNKKQIKKYYEVYEKEFDRDVEQLEGSFDSVMGAIKSLYPEGLRTTEFRRPPLFYSVFTALYHVLHGLEGLADGRPAVTSHDFPRVRNSLDRVTEIFATDEVGTLSKEERQLREDTRRATTDPSVRIRRTKFILSLIASNASA